MLSIRLAQSPQETEHPECRRALLNRAKQAKYKACGAMLEGKGKAGCSFDMSALTLCVPLVDRDVIPVLVLDHRHAADRCVEGFRNE